MGALIVGLGNPGKRYEATRHNLGERVVRAMAKRLGCSWKASEHLESLVATVHRPHGNLYLLLPMTYMNVSGRAVRKALEYWKIPLEALLVVVDDVDLPFAAMRIRPQGSSGGHNGLSDIGQALGSDAYARLRMGIGRPPDLEPMERYVLERFTSHEEAVIPSWSEWAVDVIETWLAGGIEKAAIKAAEWKKQERRDETGTQESAL